MPYHDPLSLSLEGERDQAKVGNTRMHNNRHHSMHDRNVSCDTNNINKGEKSMVWHSMALHRVA